MAQVTKTLASICPPWIQVRNRSEVNGVGIGDLERSGARDLVYGKAQRLL